MLGLSEFKTIMINMLRDPVDKVFPCKKQMGSVSQEAMLKIEKIVAEMKNAFGELISRWYSWVKNLS